MSASSFALSSDCQRGYAIYAYFGSDKTLKRVTNECHSGGARSVIRVNPTMAAQLQIMKTKCPEARFVVCCRGSSTSFPYSM